MVPALALAGCIGETSRQDFDAEIRRRGGGFDRAALADAIAHVDEAAGPDAAARSLTLDPPQATTSIEARPSGSDTLDRYSFGPEGLRNVTPVRLRPDVDLDATTFPLADLDVDVVAAVIADALVRADVVDGHVDGIGARLEVGAADEPRPLLTVDVEGPRSSAVLRYDLDGDLVDQERR